MQAYQFLALNKIFDESERNVLNLR